MKIGLASRRIAIAARNRLRERRLLSAAMLAMIDQGVLSATNFAIGIAFMRLASKADYSLYAQFFALLLLSQALQNALANAPLLALAPRRRLRARQALAAQLFRIQTAASLLLALLAFAGVVAWPGLTLGLAIAFALAIAAQWVREYARKYAYISLRPAHALATDVCFAVLLGLSLLVTVVLGRLTTVWVLAAMAGANLAAGGLGLSLERLRATRAHGYMRPTLRRAWAHSRWTLPSVALTWASNYAFIFIVATLVGASATANISAARVLAMPAGLAIVAWSNAFGPRIARWIGAGRLAHVHTVLTRSIAALTALILAYIALLALVFGWLVSYVIGADYAGVRGLVIAWGVYFALNAIRKTGTICLAADGRFKLLFVYGCAGLLVSIAATVAGTALWDTAGAIVGLSLTEIALAFAIWGHGWPRVLAHYGGGARPAVPATAR